MGSINLDEKIGTISLKDLCQAEYKFIIPTYQRGYRWRTKHVQALIDDLESITDGETYCLQPIVLQKTDDKNTFRVVDGQQRLTTLLLLLNACKIDKVWKMTPENPQETSGILNEACRANTRGIAEKTKDETKSKITGKLGKIFFIWYLLDEKEDGHAAFQRLNSGKIPLTSSELIRAKLVGTSSNPHEMAAEWERIEQRLRDDRFWFMFNGKASESFTRIDKLFEIITNTEEKVKLDRLAPYYEVEENDKVEKNDKELWWEKLLNLFWMLEQCYNDVELYHYIGWLRHFSGVQFSTLYKLYGENKIDFKQNLQKIIIGRGCDVGLSNVGQIAGLLFDKNINPPRTCNELTKYIINNFQYGNSKLKAFFVLFNIETLNAKVREKNKKTRERNEYERFPFDLYANLSWDIEHIDSHTDNQMTDPAEQIEWAIETYLEDLENKQKDEDLLNWIKSRTEQKYEEAKKEILIKLGKNEESIFGEDYTGDVCDFNSLYDKYRKKDHVDNKDLIENLTLLDHNTNRSYHNAIFPYKRREIIRVDKSGKDTKNEEVFIPPCTRNVFTKYYTNYAVSITQWTQQDADDYRKAISETFAGLIEAAGYEIKKENEK